MAKKIKATLPPLALAALSAILLVAGGLMSSFPVLVLAALSPLMAITDNSLESENPWNGLELIWIALSLGLMAAWQFDLTHLIGALIQAIGFTLAFGSYIWVRLTLGTRIGKWVIIIFWLALEYLLIKSPWRSDVILLADAFQLKPEWLKWNASLGYTAGTLWVLLTNWIFYVAIFRPSVNLVALVAFMLLATLPPVISVFSMTSAPVTRSIMEAVYQGGSGPADYLETGESVARSALWIVALVLLFTAVKAGTQKEKKKR